MLASEAETEEQTKAEQSEAQQEQTQAKEVEQKTINSDNSAQEKEQEAFSIIPEVQENALNLQFFSNSTSTEDVLSMFNSIDLTQEKSIISDEDREQTNKLEQSYKATLSVFENHLQQLKTLYEQFGDDSKTSDSISFVCQFKDIRDTQERINDLKNSFISKVCYYFASKYNVTIDYEFIRNKYDTSVTAQEIISEIIEQLNGFSFIEKAQQEIKQQFQEQTEYNKPTVKGNKLTLSSFFGIDQFDIRWGSYKLDYRSYYRAETLLKALYLYEYNITQLTEEAETLFKTLKYSKNDDVFTTHELNMKKIKSIKLYKNGRVDIEFTSSHYAREFAKDFLNIVKVA